MRWERGAESSTVSLRAATLKAPESWQQPTPDRGTLGALTSHSRQGLPFRAEEKARRAHTAEALVTLTPGVGFLCSPHY